MNQRFRHIFVKTAFIHVIVVAVFILSSFISDRLFRRQPREMVSFVSLENIPMQEVQVAPGPEPSPPEQETAPEPPPAPPEIPEQTRPQRTPVERSTRRVRREQPSEPSTRLSADEIRQRLAEEVPVSRTDSGPTSDAWHRMAFQTFHDAWAQPGAVSAGTTVTVRVRVERDGRITRRDLTRPSGNSVMDESVMRAVNSVSRLPPLPDQIRGAHYDVDIHFELEGVR